MHTRMLSVLVALLATGVIAITGATPAAAQAKPRKQKQTQTATTVYVTKTGSKYHREGCQYLRSSAIAIPLSEAKLRYDPCSRCNPPK